MITNRWNLTVCCSKSSGRRWASVVLVRKLTEWRRFHFRYQPRDALNSESSLNSFAFRRTINPLTAIPICKTKWEGYQTIERLNLTRLEFVLTFVKTGQWESFIHNVVTWYYDSFESHTFNSSADWFISWSCFCCSMLDKKLTLASLLCKPFQYSLIELRILRREASHRLPFRWQFNLAVKKVRLIFPPATDHGLTDAIFSGDSRVIFNSFCFGDYFKFMRGCMTCDEPWAWWQLVLK